MHDGAIGTAATGYSIIEADSLNAAADLARACPVLKAGGRITVYEVTPAMQQRLGLGAGRGRSSTPDYRP